jgi:hypothetical protein
MKSVQSMNDSKALRFTRKLLHADQETTMHPLNNNNQPVSLRTIVVVNEIIGELTASC